MKKFNTNDPDEVAENVYKSAAGLSPHLTKSYPASDADKVIKNFLIDYAQTSK